MPLSCKPTYKNTNGFQQIYITSCETKLDNLYNMQKTNFTHPDPDRDRDRDLDGLLDRDLDGLLLRETLCDLSPTLPASLPAADFTERFSS